MDTASIPMPRPDAHGPIPMPSGWRAPRRWESRSRWESPSSAMPMPGAAAQVHLPAAPPADPRRGSVRRRVPSANRNAAAVIGATMGCLSLVLAMIPVIGLVACLTAPVAAVLSSVGLALGAAGRRGRLGAALGLVTSALALGICGAWLLLLIG